MKQPILILILLAFSANYARIHVDRYVLDNGLQILFYPSKQVPTVACRLFYTTGSVHEGPGHTGIAHMLEHMLFKGTARVGITDSIADRGYISLIDSIIGEQR